MLRTTFFFLSMYWDRSTTVVFGRVAAVLHLDRPHQERQRIGAALDVRLLAGGRPW